MNQQCYQCHTAHDDNARRPFLACGCPKSKSNPSVAITNPRHAGQQPRAGTLTQVRDMVAALEAGQVYYAMRRRTEPEKVDQVLADAPPLQRRFTPLIL